MTVPRGDSRNAKPHSIPLCFAPHMLIEGGHERIFTVVAALIDTNILVYRFDPRFPDKQRIASELLRRGTPSVFLTRQLSSLLPS
jgi:hypothetical protein